MEKIYISTGRFAKLAQTTKRTVLWYKTHGLLCPVKTNTKGYSFYTPEQIIDLQTIMLLRKLNFSLLEIKKMIRANSSWSNILQNKQTMLENELALLSKNLTDTKTFYSNLEEVGVLVKPIIKTYKAFEAFTINKVGPYNKIYDYCVELKSKFRTIPQTATYFVLFPKETYAPHKDIFTIGVIKTKDMVLGKENDDVNIQVIPSFTSLSYIHKGPPQLLSLLIQELEKYREKKKLKKDKTVGINEIEFYYKTSLNDFHDTNFMESEINLPITT